LKLKCDEALSNFALFQLAPLHHGPLLLVGEGLPVRSKLPDVAAMVGSRGGGFASGKSVVTSYETVVGRYRLTISQPELKARLVSALETKM
jgi:hypothetical protein